MCSKAKKHSDEKKHKVRTKYYSQSSSSEEDQSSVPIKSTKPQQSPSEPEHQQDSTDPVFYREVDMSDLPSQYAEEVETFNVSTVSRLPLRGLKVRSRSVPILKELTGVAMKMSVTILRL